MEKQNWNHAVGLGIMSGTSLDGLDLALCEFSREAETWKYKTIRCETVEYDALMRKRLQEADRLGALELVALDREFAAYIAGQVVKFLAGSPAQPDFIASHGQTVYHQPERGITLQIGSGAVIAARTGIPTVCDFRTTDVALGGQGAPLVPIGDKLLFGSYAACLNLGGFCNISFDSGARRLAFDIAPCNMLLNTIAARLGQPYDKGGLYARDGYLVDALTARLNALPYYAQGGAKSLGKEWFDREVLPLLDEAGAMPQDLLRTSVEHIAVQIGRILNDNNIQSVLVTGGGAKNSYLMDRIRWHAPNTMVVIPDEATVDFKEAIIFAFLGLLRLRGECNCLADVTGAVRDNIGGAVYL
jgi:anhydro-N-acetylmuramic acid kinase